MDIATIQELLTTVGFPIVCCGAMGWFIYKVFQKFSAQGETREERLYGVIAEAQETNKKLTQTNSEFVEVLNTYRDDLAVIKEDISEIKDKVLTD